MVKHFCLSTQLHNMFIFVFSVFIVVFSYTMCSFSNSYCDGPFKVISKRRLYPIDYSLQPSWLSVNLIKSNITTGKEAGKSVVAMVPMYHLFYFLKVISGCFQLKTMCKI